MSRGGYKREKGNERKFVEDRAEDPSIFPSLVHNCSQRPYHDIRRDIRSHLFYMQFVLYLTRPLYNSGGNTRKERRESKRSWIESKTLRFPLGSFSHSYDWSTKTISSFWELSRIPLRPFSFFFFLDNSFFFPLMN